MDVFVSVEPHIGQILHLPQVQASDLKIFDTVVQGDLQPPHVPEVLEDFVKAEHLLIERLVEPPLPERIE